MKKYLPLKVKVWKTVKHITLAYQLSSDSMNMRSIASNEGVEYAMKVIRRLKDDLTNIHADADYIGDLTVTSIFYDSITDRITLVDWKNYQPKRNVHILSIPGQ